MNVKVLAAAAAISLLSFALPSHARLGLGLDVVRAIDENQDGGMSNGYIQAGTSASGALLFGYARGERLTILDAAYKLYLGRYGNGAFMRFGAGFYEDNDSDLSDMGFVGAFGYERHLAKHLVASGSVKLVSGIDEQLIGYGESPVYQPTLGVMLAF